MPGEFWSARARPGSAPASTAPRTIGQRGVTAIAVSPDGRLLAAGCPDRLIKVWETATWKEEATIQAHTDWILSLAFDPSGTTLASGSQDRTARLWNVSDWTCRTTISGLSDFVRSVAYSPDGKTLTVAGSTGILKLCDPVTGQDRCECPQFVGPAIFAPDSNSLLVGKGQGLVELRGRD